MSGGQAADLPEDIAKTGATMEEENKSAPRRPANPMDCSLSNEQLFEQLPPRVGSILHKCKTLGTLYGEDTKALRDHLETVMSQSGNPFPITKLYKEYVGGEISSVLNEDLGKKLDHYWEKWELPQPEPPKVSTTGALPEQLTLKPQDIPGVIRGADGRFAASDDTVTWIKQQLSATKDSAAAVELVDRMRGLFGNEIIARVKRSVTAANNARAEQMNRSGLGDERSQLESLNRSVTHNDLPGIKLVSGQIVFSPETVAWVEDRVTRMIKYSINPDEFCMSIFDMCGEDAIRRMFREDWARISLSQLPGCTTWPTFLEKMIRELVLPSRRSSLLGTGDLNGSGPMMRPMGPGPGPMMGRGGGRMDGRGMLDLSPAAEAAIANAMQRESMQGPRPPQVFGSSSITGIVGGGPPRPMGGMGPFGGPRGPRPMPPGIRMRGQMPPGMGMRGMGPMGPMGPMPRGPMGGMGGRPMGASGGGPIRPRGQGGRPMPYEGGRYTSSGGGGRPYVEKVSKPSGPYYSGDEGGTPGSRKSRTS